MALFLFRAPLTLVSHSATFIYPLYASYKAITPGARDGAVRRDAQTELLELQTWLMYWSVAGVMHVAEVYVEWIWNWVPFYFEAKLLFVLWLVLPQTRGATLLYVSYIDPFLAEHEESIDAALTEAKVQAKQAGLAYVGRAWDYVKGSILTAAMSQAVEEQPAPSSHVGPAAPPPSTQNPIQGTTSQLYSLFSTYAPLAVAAGTSALNRARAGAQAAPPEHSAAAASSSSMLKRNSALNAARRAELQRQLSELDDASGSDEGGRSSALPVPRSAAERRVASSSRAVEHGNSSGDSSGHDEFGKTAGSNKRGLDGSYEMLDNISVDIPLSLQAGGGRRTRAAAAAAQQDAPAADQPAGSGSWFWGGASPSKSKTQ